MGQWMRKGDCGVIIYFARQVLYLTANGNHQGIFCIYLFKKLNAPSWSPIITHHFYSHPLLETKFFPYISPCFPHRYMASSARWRYCWHYSYYWGRGAGERDTWTLKSKCGEKWESVPLECGTVHRAGWRRQGGVSLGRSPFLGWCAPCHSLYGKRRWMCRSLCSDEWCDAHGDSLPLCTEPAPWDLKLFLSHYCPLLEWTPRSQNNFLPSQGKDVAPNLRYNPARRGVPPTLGDFSTSLDWALNSSILRIKLHSLIVAGLCTIIPLPRPRKDPHSTGRVFPSRTPYYITPPLESPAAECSTASPGEL